MKREDIGNDAAGKPMILRSYGTGPQTAVFFIGGLHGDEFGGIWSVEIMEKFIGANTGLIPPSAKIYFLNPANDLGQLSSPENEAELKNEKYRTIPPGEGDAKGIDPNRDFFDRKLAVTGNIAVFTEFLHNNYANVIVISAHSANDPQAGGTKCSGIVLPKFKLTGSGMEKEKNRSTVNPDTGGIKLDAGDFISPEKSEKLAREFAEITGFGYAPLWNDEMYTGEYMDYISRMGKDITMIEFETRYSLERDFIEKTWKTAYETFVKKLLEKDTP